MVDTGRVMISSMIAAYTRCLLGGGGRETAACTPSIARSGDGRTQWTVTELGLRVLAEETRVAGVSIPGGSDISGVRTSEGRQRWLQHCFPEPMGRRQPLRTHHSS